MSICWSVMCRFSLKVQDSYCTLSGKRHMTDQQIDIAYPENSNFGLLWTHQQSQRNVETDRAQRVLQLKKKSITN